MLKVNYFMWKSKLTNMQEIFSACAREVLCVRVIPNTSVTQIVIQRKIFNSLPHVIETIYK